MKNTVRTKRFCGFLITAMMFAQEARAAGDDILTSGKRLYSQSNEELIIRHFFDDRRDGVFVDVGAFHWKKFSTTYYLEHHLGWSGVAIDAQPQFAAAYAVRRPKTKFFAYIVTDHSGTEESFYLAGALSSTKDSHVADLVKMAGTSVSPENAKKATDTELTEVKVPTITLNKLLDDNGITKVDFLSMDIEQGEPAALAGFDIERFAPELVCIEAFALVRD
jgi:FkbM family methyltransferase